MIGLANQHQARADRDGYCARVEAAMFQAAIALYGTATDPALPTTKEIRGKLVNDIVKGVSPQSLNAFAWLCASGSDRTTIDANDPAGLNDNYLISTCSNVAFFDIIAYQLFGLV